MSAEAVPFDLFARRADWQLATLLVALVLVPGAAAGADVHLGRALRRVDGGPTPVRRGGRGQPVRPPRSC